MAVDLLRCASEGLDSSVCTAVFVLINECLVAGLFAFFSAAMDIEEEGAVQMISYASDTESASLRLVKSEKIVKRSVVASVD